jgi:CcmD family protein
MNYERKSSNMFFLAAALISVWVMVTVYLIYLYNRQRRLEVELEVLQETMQERADKLKG